MEPLPLYRNETVIDNITGANQQYLTGFYTSEATSWIAANHNRPFFMVLAHTKVHTPFAPLQFFLQRSVNGTYGAEVGEIDYSTGDVLNALAGARSNTLVVFLSDNGGTVHGDNGPLRGFKGSFLEGGVRVPMIWNWPGHIPIGTNSKVASVMDLLPTFVGLAGGTVPRLDGKDIMPMLQSPAVPSPYASYRYYAIGWQKVKAIRAGNYKLNLTTNELFNVASDLGEAHNIARQNPKIVTHLRELAR
jgi:arylsulfatase A-like enzyme